MRSACSCQVSQRDRVNQKSLRRVLLTARKVMKCGAIDDDLRSQPRDGLRRLPRSGEVKLIALRRKHVVPGIVAQKVAAQLPACPNEQDLHGSKE
jgi:hypothetical protein